MVQLIRLASATNRGGTGNTSFPADFTVNIQNNITITKNASVALKGTSFSTNDANLIQVPANVRIGISGQNSSAGLSYGTLEQGKFDISQLPSVVFNSILSAMDFKQLVLNNALTSDMVRGFEILPNIDLITKKISFNCQMQPTNEVCLSNASIFPLPPTYLTYSAETNRISATANAPAQDFIDGKVFMTGNKKLLMGCFQFKVNALYTVVNIGNITNGDGLTFGLINQQSRAKTTLTPADYILCVKGNNVAGVFKYQVWYNGASTQTNVVVDPYDIVYFILERGKIKAYVERRIDANLNTRNLSVELTAGISIPYSINYQSTQSDGYYPVVQFNRFDVSIIPNNTIVAGNKIGGSYYTPTNTQNIDNDGNILDYGTKYIPNEYTIIQASGGSLSGDIQIRAGKALLLDMSQGAFALLNTNTKLIGSLNNTSENFVGNGVVRLSLYGDIIVELLDFDLSSYNSNYPDRKSILYVIEKLEEIGNENSTLYSFDVNYPIFLNIFNRDDMNVNSFRIRITKDGVPINLTSGATITLLIDG